MQYGLCNLSIVPVRAEASDGSEMVTQLLYGDCFEVLDSKENWLHICIAFDQYVGWIDAKQAYPIQHEDFTKLSKQTFFCTNDLIEFVSTKSNQLIPISIGSCLGASELLQHQFEGNFSHPSHFQKKEISKIALLYLNAPYLWGGKTPFGIDCSGFTQMVYKICGFALQRDAFQQAKQGISLSFVEECEEGDLAFFDNEEGKIIHVGIVLKDNYIIHAHGKVRIDRIDHAGIFNVDTNTYSHNLRVIKSMG